MGKSSAPPSPDYKGEAIATANLGKYNEVTPYGSVNWATRPGADPDNPQAGDYTRTTVLSPEQQQLYSQNLANQLQAGGLFQDQVANLNKPDFTVEDFNYSGGSEGSRQQLADAMYNRATRYYDTQFGNQQQQLEGQLASQGLSRGSEAYDKAMTDFNQQRDTAYADATDRALLAAEQQRQATAQEELSAGQLNTGNQIQAAGVNEQIDNNALARLGQILAMGQGTTPQSANANATGPDLLNAANQQYGADVARTNAQNAQSANTTSTLATLGTLLYMYSDRRLKSKVVRLGTGYGGLSVYEYEIFGERQIGYMADEVEARYPQAVARDSDGWLMVDYGLLGGVPTRQSIHTEG